MISVLRSRPLPASQRRSLDDLAELVDLSPQRSQAVNFWLMLALSSIVATVGIIADSTPTAISTVITAPLSTPTMGIALQSV